MNEKQKWEFAHIVQQCEGGQYRSINVASKIRSDAIVAAWCELSSLRIESPRLRAHIAELETKLRRLERFYSHTFAGTGVTRCAHCGSEGDSAEPPEHASTCPYYGLPVIDLEAES